MKRINFRIVIVGCLLSVAMWQSVAWAQLRGQALYEYMSRERLTDTTGVREVKWLSDGSGYFISEVDTATKTAKFFRVDPHTQKRLPLLDANSQTNLLRALQELTGREVKDLPSKNFKYILNGSALFFSADKRDFIFDLKTNKLREMRRPEIKPQPGSKDLMRRMTASQLWNGEYSLDYKKFAYVRDYDLYVADTETGEEKQLTFGGHENLLHGRPDWVYPEEFNQLTAYWWSPDGRKLAYYEFDESAVYDYPIVHDLKPEAELELQNYPKAGEPNPTVKLFVIDLASGKNVEVQTNSSSEIYLVKPQWLPDGNALAFQKLNRRQNELELLFANPESGTTRTILTENEEAFINLHDDFIALQDGRHFLWSSERSGWRHLYLYDVQGKLVRQLTSGEWPVGKIIGVDEKNKLVYFTGYTNTGLETHFFRVDFGGKKVQQLTTKPGTHSVSLDPTCQYYTDSFSSFTTPLEMNLHLASGKLLHNLSTTNTTKLNTLHLLAPELVLVKAADGTTDLHGLLFKPADFDPNRKYPLLVSVYGGPHSKSVRNSFEMNSRLQRFAQLGFIVWTQDNRGLVNRGKRFEAETYLKLGQLDVADQTAGVKQIIQQHAYVDGSRVGVFGWSYGGYMTCMLLLQEPEVFHVGVGGAPVTDWRNYDTIYTERYMRTPQENEEGYELGSALTHTKNLKGKLFLIHGSTDNNVHPGNTMQLIEALVQEQKDFNLMFYPQQRHGVRGPGARHWNKLMIEYFLQHLHAPGFSEAM